jgi:hypothetical protein
MDVALTSEDSYTALPGTVQLVRIDGEPVFERHPQVIKRRLREAKVAIVLTLEPDDPRSYTHLAMLESAFSLLATDERGAGCARRYRLKSDCLEAHDLPDLAFKRFSSSETINGMECELLFLEYDQLGAT